MILAIDVGNTNIVLGGIQDGTTVFSARLASDRNKTEDEYALAISGIFSMHGVTPADIEGGILSSVVPYLRTVLPRAIRILTGKDIMVVGSGIKTGLNIRMDDPATVGSDLIVSAVAARAKYKPPIAIFDLGTATTLAVIDKNGDYVGGMIIPGVWVSLNSLSAHAAQLPYIDLSGPAELLGRNTIDSMRAGSVIGCAAMLDGLVGRLEAHLGEPVNALLTGGLGALIAPYCERTFYLEPDLPITGLRLLYEKNRTARNR